MKDEVSYHNENFPVGMLINSNLKPLVKAYYKAARLADNIADDPLLDCEQKLAKLKDIREAFMAPNAGNNLIVIRKLGRLFMKENLDASLFLDLLTAFERDASGQVIHIWEELIDYCRFSAAPVGRFMLAINNENPSAYLPAENLCILLQLVDHLSDMKDDLSLLKRVYIPQDILTKYNLRASDLGLSYSKSEVKEMISELIEKLDAMQADVKVLPRLVKSFRLRLEIGVILSLTNYMIQRYKKVDILQKLPKLTVWHWCKAFCNGVITALFCKYSKQGQIL